MNLNDCDYDLYLIINFLQEVSSVFGHYGIYVNSRHLSLIADYMTKSGMYRAFNRHSLVTHPSLLQQMSFETVTNALKSAVIEGQLDIIFIYIYNMLKILKICIFLKKHNLHVI